MSPRRALFQKAAAQNHPGALERMGAFAEGGRGGEKDAAAAKAYYEKAAALGNEDAKAALKRAECPYVIKDKRGNVVTNLCFLGGKRREHVWVLAINGGGRVERGDAHDTQTADRRISAVFPARSIRKPASAATSAPSSPAGRGRKARARSTIFSSALAFVVPANSMSSRRTPGPITADDYCWHAASTTG